MKKKVFFIMSTDDFSGAEAVNFSIIDNLSDKYDFYWVSRKGNINNFLAEKNIKWIEINKLSVKEIKRIVKKYEPDILHATDYKASVICSLAGVKIPLIEHLHNNSSWLKKISINSFAFLYAGLRANKILTVSESIENEYIFSKFIKNKIECIDNPISREKILSKVNQEDYKKSYDICCTARIVSQKNPFKFLDVLYNIKKDIPSVKAIWIGDGELKEKVIERVKKLGLENNIKFIGFQKNPYKDMAKAKVFMLTSDTEGYGLVAFEALTLGLPCVVSDVGGLPKIIDDRCGKLCKDKEQFSKEIINLLKDNEYYKLKSEEALKKAEKIENIDEYMKKIERIYEVLLDEKRY